MGEIQRWKFTGPIAPITTSLALGPSLYTYPEKLRTTSPKAGMGQNFSGGLYLCYRFPSSGGWLMSVFGWLILGHFVADWILQNDWMALGKTKGMLAMAGFTHYIVYTVTILIFLAISIPNCIATEISCATPATLVVITIVIFLSHWLIDGGNLAWRWMQCFGQRDQTMVRVVIDQTFHLLVLGGIVSVCLGNIPTI